MEQGDRTQLLVLRVICAALAASVVIYAIVGWLAARGAAGAWGPVPPLLPAVLVAVAAAFLVAAHPVQRALAARAAAGGGFDGVRLAFIVGFALREAAAVVGLVLTFLTGDPRWILGIGALTLLAMAAAWPTAVRVRRALGVEGAPIEP